MGVVTITMASGEIRIIPNAFRIDKGPNAFWIDRGRGWELIPDDPMGTDYVTHVRVGRSA